MTYQCPKISKGISTIKLKDRPPPLGRISINEGLAKAMDRKFFACSLLYIEHCVACGRMDKMGKAEGEARDEAPSLFRLSGIVEFIHIVQAVKYGLCD